MTVNSVPDSRPTVRTSTRQTACSVNAIPIASSRPMRSDAQPQKIRLPPLASALNEVAAASAAAGMPHDRCHRAGVGGDEQTAGRHHHEHRVQHVELRRAQHLAGRVVMLAQLRRSRRPTPRPARRRCGGGCRRNCATTRITTP